LFFASLGDLKPKIVMPVTAAARYASGRLFSMRNGTLMTQPFDPSAGKVTGEAAPLVEGVLWDVGVWRGVFDVSENGLLVYEQGSASAARSLGWFDQNGKMLSSIDVPTGYQTMALSPDGRFLAVQGNPATDLWNYDLARGIHTRLTFDSATHAYPAWSPDDKWIAYVSIQGSGAGDKICRKRADGSGAEEVLWESPKNKVLSSWSPDGKYLFFIQSNDGNAGSGIWALPVEGDRKPFSVVETPSQTTDGAVSPDGKWFSYSSAESGRSEVYVIGFPKPAGKWQVSLDGGSNALWSKDGRTIFFLSVTNRLMSTEVNGKGSEFSVGKARSYFILPASVATQPWFGTSPDGKRFVSPAATTENQPPMTLVTNWTAELKR
jgi:Tol biopolymer transport system component